MDGGCDPRPGYISGIRRSSFSRFSLVWTEYCLCDNSLQLDENIYALNKDGVCVTFSFILISILR